MSRLLVSALALVLSLALLTGGGTALADQPSVLSGPQLQPLPPTAQSDGQPNVTLAARLLSSQGEPLPGRSLTFYVLTTVFGERLMKIGESITDGSGTASLIYEPSWQGDRTMVVRYFGGENLTPAQASFQLTATEPVELHHTPAFGLEPVRRWLPLAVGMAVLAMWGTIGFVMMRTVMAGLETAPPLPLGLRVPSLPTLKPAPLGRPLAGLGALMVAVLVVAGVMFQGRADDLMLWNKSSDFIIDNRPPLNTSVDISQLQPQKPLQASLLRTIPTMIVDAAGRVAPGSADLPSDVAVINERVFVLDTNRGRILSLGKDGKLAPILESGQGEISVRGASAMISHYGSLYVANAAGGNVLVLNDSGRPVDVIRPQLPESEHPLAPAGIAVNEKGQIWLSDPENDRLVLIERSGKVAGSVGEKAASQEQTLTSPAGLVLDASGNLVVVDTFSRTVKKFSQGGAFLGSFGADRLADPQALAVDGKGRIFVSDGRLMSVLVFGGDGAYLGSIGKETEGQKSQSWLQSPHGLKTVGSLLYVMDRLTGILIFQPGAGGSP